MLNAPEIARIQKDLNLFSGGQKMLLRGSFWVIEIYWIDLVPGLTQRPQRFTQRPQSQIVKEIHLALSFFPLRSSAKTFASFAVKIG